MALSQTEIIARLSPHFPGEAGRQLLFSISSAHADIAAIKAWGDALAAKLNADAGVTDTNYVGPTVSVEGI